MFISMFADQPIIKNNIQIKPSIKEGFNYSHRALEVVQMRIVELDTDQLNCLVRLN